ncbi:MAG TPA: hypothetical protein VG965_02430 [Patescibacteria group bacterium]|nr:hypothetical protein [Patescibacteria group bacterium]
MAGFFGVLVVATSIHELPFVIALPVGFSGGLLAFVIVSVAARYDGQETQQSPEEIFVGLLNEIRHDIVGALGNTLFSIAFITCGLLFIVVVVVAVVAWHTLLGIKFVKRSLINMSLWGRIVLTITVGAVVILGWYIIVSPH